MEQRRLKQTNKDQMELLLDLMKKNPDIARGNPSFGSRKMASKEKWSGFAKSLNAIGPPTRSQEEWSRVWTNYKANLKRKLANNKKNFQATGGGRSTEISLNAMEQSAVELISLDQQADPPGICFGLRKNPNDLTTLTELAPQSSSASEMEDAETEAPTTSKTTCCKKPTASIDEQRFQILKDQANNQVEILETLKKIESTLYKDYKLKQKMYDFKVRKLEFEIEHKEAKLKYKEEKLKRKRQKRTKANSEI